MKKLVLVVVAAIGLFVGAASASAVQYPPTAQPWITGPQTVSVSEAVTITIGNAIAGETVRLTLDGATYSVRADNSGVSDPGAAATMYGSATFTITAPGEPGCYPVSATLEESTVTLSTSVTVVGADNAPDCDDTTSTVPDTTTTIPVDTTTTEPGMTTTTASADATTTTEPRQTATTTPDETTTTGAGRATTVVVNPPTSAAATTVVPGGQLPKTGGGGSANGFAIGAVLLVGGAVLVFVAKRRRVTIDAN